MPFGSLAPDVPEDMPEGDPAELAAARTRRRYPQKERPPSLVSFIMGNMYKNAVEGIPGAMERATKEAGGLQRTGEVQYAPGQSDEEMSLNAMGAGQMPAGLEAGLLATGAPLVNPVNLFKALPAKSTLNAGMRFGSAGGDAAAEAGRARALEARNEGTGGTNQMLATARDVERRTGGPPEPLEQLRMQAEAQAKLDADLAREDAMRAAHPERFEGFDLGSGVRDQEGRAAIAAANSNAPNVLHPEMVMDRIARNPELARIAAEPTEAAQNPFVQRSLENATARSEQRTAELTAGLPENPTSADILNAVKGADNAPGAEAGAAAGPGAGRGSLGSGSVEEASRAAAAAGGPRVPLQGLPTKPIEIEPGVFYKPGPIDYVQTAAESYMKEAGLPYNPPKTYAQVDVPRAERIAQAFQDMAHNPSDPKVQASYNAMIDETVKQYKAIENSGVRFEFIKPGQPDPYAASPRLAQADFAHNKHLWVFPTDTGFGSGTEASAAAMRNNPLLRPTDITIEGKQLLANDVFRIVHDVFGHLKEGVGFRAAGEENAWRSHSAMYSDAARPAMTTETRGQNSWLNYGPHGEKNRTAKTADTVFADQKIGILPDWAVNEGRFDPGTLGAGARDKKGSAAAAAATEGAPKLPTELYHVVPEGADVSGGLKSLYKQHGNAAYDMFAERWPEAGNLGEYHVHHTMFYPDLASAKSHAEGLGGRILKVDPAKLDELKFDRLEEPGYWATNQDVPASALKELTSGAMPQLAERYPELVPPQPAIDKKTGKPYLEKVLSPEELQLSKVREKAQRDIEAGNYTPYFNPAKPTDVNPKSYPAPVDTLAIQPTRAATVAKWRTELDTPQAMDRLQAAYEHGKTIPNSKNFYTVGQLQTAFVKELGAKEGQQAFKDRFAIPMAATTGGARPSQNLLQAHYGNYLQTNKLPYPQAGYETPHPVGGRYITGNLKQHEKMFGGDIDELNPKRHNFAYNFMGHVDRATIDEQMMDIINPKFQAPPKGTYGITEEMVHRAAAKAGVSPREFQEVAWAGHKAANEKNYTQGKPMMVEVNEAIERTHRVTGMPRDEIVKRGLIRGEIPLYGLAAATAGALGLKASDANAMDVSNLEGGGKIEDRRITMAPHEAPAPLKLTVRPKDSKNVDDMLRAARRRPDFGSLAPRR